MGIEKLIERLNTYSAEHQQHGGITAEAADALSTLQIGNQALRNAANGFKAENEKLRAELEHAKEERNAAVNQLHGLCSACKNYSPYHNKGKCRYCLYESARNKYAEVNDNWEWRGPERGLTWHSFTK